MDATQTWAQHGEDVVIERFFGGRAGRYVEVGAHDGESLSNTYRLDRAGWEGICIEAHPVHGRHLVANRPDADVVLAACVARANGPIDFHIEPSGLLSGVAPLAEDEIARRYARRGEAFPGLRKVSVPTTTLDDVLHERELRPADVDVLSIDVEGTELDVLRGLTLKDGGPTLIIAEANDRAHARRLREYLQKNGGYALAGRLGVNAMFCPPSHVDQLRGVRANCWRADAPSTAMQVRVRQGLPRRSASLLARQLIHRLGRR